MRLFDTFPLGLAAALALAGCERQAAPVQYPQGYASGQLNPGQWSADQASQQGYTPGQFMAQGAYPPAQPLPQGPPVAADPITDVDLNWLHAAAGGVLNELVAALPPASQARVQGIPFVADSTVGEVNAYAACNEQHMPLMAVTDGLLQIESYVAQLRATDEVFGTQKLDAYLLYLAKNQRPHQPIVAPPPGLVDPVQSADYRKVVRQHQLFEEQAAFVLGHELAHHHLGHTGCANGQSGQRDVTAIDVLRRATRVVPFINMPNEMWADEAGVWDLLTAGARRRGYHWTEQGALLTLHFFSKLDPLTLDSLVFAFASSHPNPALRVGPIQQAAARWRQSNGRAPWQAPVLP